MPPLPWKSFWSFYSFMLAVLIASQIGLGIYMTGLEFFHPWYHAAPRIHKSIGLTIASMVLLRLIFRLRSGIPTFREFIASLRYNVYGVKHLLLYGLLLTAATAGFGFATSTGDPVPFFGLFDIPAPFILGKEAGEILDTIHVTLAMSLVILIALHSIEKMRLLLHRRKTRGIR